MPQCKRLIVYFYIKSDNFGTKTIFDALKKKKKKLLNNFEARMQKTRALSNVNTCGRMHVFDNKKSVLNSQNQLSQRSFAIFTSSA